MKIEYVITQSQLKLLTKMLIISSNQVERQLFYEKDIRIVRTLKKQSIQLKDLLEQTKYYDTIYS